MQSVSSRIWTRVAVSIFYDDNHYTTGHRNWYPNETRTHSWRFASLTCWPLLYPRHHSANTQDRNLLWTSIVHFTTKVVGIGNVHYNPITINSTHPTIKQNSNIRPHVRGLLAYANLCFWALPLANYKRDLMSLRFQWMPTSQCWSEKNA